MIIICGLEAIGCTKIVVEDAVAPCSHACAHVSVRTRAYVFLPFHTVYLVHCYDHISQVRYLLVCQPIAGGQPVVGALSGRFLIGSFETRTIKKDTRS